MGNGATKNAVLVILAMAVGLTLDAVTKFGFGYDLSADTPPAKFLATE
jgi:hypothetical protein